MPGGAWGGGGDTLLLQMWLQLFTLPPRLQAPSPSRLKILSPSASTMSFSAASSVTLKKYFSSGSLAMNLISRMKSSGSCCRRR